MCDIMLAGVGGQGLMVLSSLMGVACNRLDMKVITAEEHGLAQRSGSIYVHVRIGEKYSPLIPYGCADFLISMEAMETLRHIEYVRDQGFIIVNERILHPIIETDQIVKNRSELKYLTVKEIVEKLHEVTTNIFLVDATGLARAAGNARAENVVLLGCASALPGFPLDKTVLKDVIGEVLPPKTVGANIKAFDLGYEEGLKMLKEKG